MSGYIMVSKDLLTDIRFRRVVRAYIASRERHASDAKALSYETGVTHVLGALAQLWIFADTHICDDNTIEATTDEIDELVGIAGFCNLLPADWFQVVDSDCIQLTDFLQHNGTVAKKKANHANRQARYRERQKNAANDVTESPRDIGSDASASPSHPIPSLPIPSLSEEKNTSASPTPARSIALKVSRGTIDPEWLLDFKLVYPDRAGDQGWRKAVKAANARIAQGHMPAEFIAGAKRYAAFCDATGKTGTEFVKQAATFLGPDKPFLLPWEIPPTKADVRLAGNVEAALEAKRRIFGDTA